MLQAGMRLGGRYRLADRVGAGGMGEVWRAADEVLGRTVAVKAMLPHVAGEQDFARRFLAEARAMAGVNSPAVASIHDYGQDAGVTYLVMEFIDGESLSQALARMGRIRPSDAMRMIAQAADGLQAVHDAGIVHRDIKPANLLLRRDGAVVLTDFGISRAGEATGMTLSGAVLGTPTYLSPEQVLGHPATRLSDLYSLGVAAYECLSGRKPFAGDNPYAVAVQRVQGPPAPLPDDVPRAVAAVVERAMAQDPARRWPSAAAMAEAARAAGQGGPAPVPVRPRKRRVWPVLAAVLAVLAVAGAGVVVWKVGERSTAEAVPAPPAQVPSGFEECAEGLCPSEPLCWGGLFVVSGVAQQPRRIVCTQTHAWETFAAVPATADMMQTRQDELMMRPDVGAACSVDVMLERARTRNVTKGWVRDAVPMRVNGAEDVLMHCLARPPDVESGAPAFG